MDKKKRLPPQNPPYHHRPCKERGAHRRSPAQSDKVTCLTPPAVHQRTHSQVSITGKEVPLQLILCTPSMTSKQKPPRPDPPAPSPAANSPPPPCEGLWSYDYTYTWHEYTPPPPATVSRGKRGQWSIDNRLITKRYARPPHKQFFVACSSPFTRLAGHLTAPRAWLAQAMPAWSVKTRRAPSRHCREAKVYGHFDYGHP